MRSEISNERAKGGEKRPGFAEIDLVAHDGGSSFGDFLQTLNATDVFSGWCEVQAVRNKAQVWVFGALKEIRSRLPFKLLGIDSDNGSEFINDQLFRYCQSEKLTFTRSRPYRKNDNCFVEQKNYTAVRRYVGYQRMEGERVLATVNDLYHYLRLYINYFQPVMHLATKERQGSHVKKTYSPAETPFQRLHASLHITRKQKEKMRREYESLNPAELKRRIEALQEKLLKMAVQARLKTPTHRSAHPWRQPGGGLRYQKYLK
ncbi:MAG: transposase family protein [Acidobacteriota bacterium]